MKSVGFFSLNVFLLCLLLCCTNSQSPSCYFTCQTCSSSSAYACRSCIANISNNSPIQQYVWSCQQFDKNNGLYLTLSIVIVLLNVFMFSIGFGVYHSIYNYIQLTSILIWVQVTNNHIISLQPTNFAIEYNNSFSRTFGAQFLCILFILAVFAFLVLSVQKIPHNPTAILIRRKRIIFPFRVVSLVFNMLLFSSLASIYTIQSLSQIDIFELFITILSLCVVAFIYAFYFYICNLKRYKLDDPHYYVITQRLLSTRWWVKNKLLIQMTKSIIIIVCFVIGFSMPYQMMMIIIVFEVIYLLYLFFLISWTKIRYKVINMIGTILFIAILVCLMGLNIQPENAQIFSKYYSAYIIMTIILCSLFIIAIVVQILAQRHTISRQLRSFNNRFILCQNLQKQVQMNKYDAHVHRKKVTQFTDNHIYGCDLSQIKQKLLATESNDFTKK